MHITKHVAKAGSLSGPTQPGKAVLHGERGWASDHDSHRSRSLEPKGGALQGPCWAMGGSSSQIDSISMCRTFSNVILCGSHRSTMLLPRRILQLPPHPALRGRGLPRTEYPTGYKVYLFYFISPTSRPQVLWQLKFCFVHCFIPAPKYCLAHRKYSNACCINRWTDICLFFSS